MQPDEGEPAMPFTEYGVYELVVFRALPLKAPAPWSVTDLDALEDVITEQFCAEHWPDCQHFEVLDWIRALSGEDRAEIIARCNDTWASTRQL